MNPVQIAERAYGNISGGPRNLSTAERIGSVVLGMAAVGTASRQRPLLGALIAAAGFALVGRGVSGHCAAKASLLGGEEHRAERALAYRPTYRNSSNLATTEAAP